MERLNCHYFQWQPAGDLHYQPVFTLGPASTHCQSWLSAHFLLPSEILMVINQILKPIIRCQHCIASEINIAQKMEFDLILRNKYKWNWSWYRWLMSYIIPTTLKFQIEDYYSEDGLLNLNGIKNLQGGSEVWCYSIKRLPFIFLSSSISLFSLSLSLTLRERERESWH